VPLSRPKKNITRDFADGGKSNHYLVLLAELVAHYFPKLVELHNYTSTTSATTKLSNWNTLNSNSFLKLRKSIEKIELSD
jgi:hypothetical protein